MWRCCLLLLVVGLAACRSSPAPSTEGIAPTQTRAAELAQLAQIPVTQTRLAELTQLTQVAGIAEALGPAPRPSTPVPPLQASQPTATARAITPPATATGAPRGSTTSTAGISRRATPSKPGVPTFFELVVDEARGRLYGSDTLGGRVMALALSGQDVIGTVDLGQASEPNGLALSPDGSELAVALNGRGEIALVDLDSLTLSKRLLPTVDVGTNSPYDVLYGRPGLLYSTGNPGSGGFDYIHVFDTAAGVEIGRSTDVVRADPRLAISADGTLFVSEPGFSPQQLYRYAVKDNTPVLVASGPHGPVDAPALAVREDGSAVYTAGGQVWSGNLQSQLGSFAAKGTNIEYVAATERLFVCRASAVFEVEAQGNYAVVATHTVSATARVARANKAGTTLYVSTDAGLDVIQLAAH